MKLLSAAMSPSGPSLIYCDVRDLVVIRGKADMMRTSDFGRY
jgi:hypothetical protein